MKISSYRKLAIVSSITSRTIFAIDYLIIKSIIVIIQRFLFNVLDRISIILIAYYLNNKILLRA